MYSDPRDARSQDPDTQPLPAVGTGERQRAAIWLGGLAIAALVVVGIMVAVLGSSGSGTPPTQPNALHTGPNVIATGGSGQPHPHGSGRPARSRPHRPPRQPSSSPRSGPVSCPTSAPCSLPDDVGNAVQALNDYRAAHGKPAVRGTVTQAARDCAVNEGNNCAGGYFWEPVQRSGHEVIDKIAAASDGPGWLLSDRMTVVQVGWAYIPSSKSFECALISNS